MSGDPFPKVTQLARGERRYHRKAASPAQWQRIAESKRGPCRVCSGRDALELHHLVLRSRGGDDVADNIVPLCHECHVEVTAGDRRTLRVLAASLSDGEYAYIVGKLGEQGIERTFGVKYGRT